jgi:hypothetical protein
MNWEAFGAVAEMLGSLTVIGTIFYLAIQVKHSTSVSKASARQLVSQMSVDAIAITLDSQILSRASMKATSGEELSPEEYSNYIRWVAMRMRVFENVYYQYQQGLIDSDVWRPYTIAIKVHLGPGSVAQAHWDYVSDSYSASFVNEVNRILAAV